MIKTLNKTIDKIKTLSKKRIVIKIDWGKVNYTHLTKKVKGFYLTFWEKRIEFLKIQSRITKKSFIKIFLK